MDIFFRMLQMGLAGSFAVFYLLILRFLLRKFPKRLTYALWALVALHLLCTTVPVGRVAIIPYVDIVQELWYVEVNWNVIVVIYLIGVGLILFANMVNYYRLTHRLKKTARMEESFVGQEGKVYGIPVPVYRCADISGAFTFGYFPPGIYLPKELDPKMKEMIVCHEMTHIHRGDHIVKLLAFVLCALNWYNPLIWFAFYYFVRDQEASCDELVLQKLGMDHKKQYADTIFRVATGFFRSSEMDHAMPFGEANIKYRIRRCVKAVHTERKTFALMILVTLLFFVLGISVSSVFQINHLPFVETEDGEIIGGIKNDRIFVEYQMRGNGIYQVDQQGEKLIYRGKFNSGDCFNLYEREIYFLGGNQREILRLDIDTGICAKVFRCRIGKKIESFTPHNGLITISYTDGTQGESKFYIKNPESVSTQEILEHPGNVYNVTQWKKDGAYARLDLDGDGKDEEMFLDFSAEDMMTGGNLLYSFSINNNVVIQKEINLIFNEIYAISPDGEHIYVALTDGKGLDGGVTPETTTFYQYENGSLNSYGEIQAPINLINFADGTITVMRIEKIIFGETCLETWQTDADGRFVRMDKETDCVSLESKEYDLQKDIDVHTEPESKETFHVTAQRVGLHQVMKNQQWDVCGTRKKGYWVELMFHDDIKGWIFISDGQLENGERTEEVFGLAVYHHPITTSSGNK